MNLLFMQFISLSPLEAFFTTTLLLASISIITLIIFDFIIFLLPILSNGYAMLTERLDRFEDWKYKYSVKFILEMITILIMLGTIWLMIVTIKHSSRDTRSIINTYRDETKSIINKFNEQQELSNKIEMEKIIKNINRIRQEIAINIGLMKGLIEHELAYTEGNSEIMHIFNISAYTQGTCSTLYFYDQSLCYEINKLYSSIIGLNNMISNVWEINYTTMSLNDKKKIFWKMNKLMLTKVHKIKDKSEIVLLELDSLISKFSELYNKGIYTNYFNIS
ncbi:hypothetical protein ACFL57_00775 [Candidatus Margulisiibacteriota bacterium]